jgi:hypothetical protein
MKAAACHRSAMTTGSAALSPVLAARLLTTVTSTNRLEAAGVSRAAARAQIDAGRWQRLGRAIVLHNGPLTRREQWDAALVCVGPRAVLTSFTALEAGGLSGWEREDVHVLVHAGGSPVAAIGLPLRLHRTRRWSDVETHRLGARHHPAYAAVVAARSFSRSRPAVGLIAACVQQRLARPVDLVAAIEGAGSIRHKRALLYALADIGMGSHALAEIDFVRLCRRAGLPEPRRQAVRVEPSGRRRYLDAEWTLRDGSSLLVEVDGSLHLSAARWWADQVRQNELVLAGAAVLRFPSAVVREEPELVIAQLRRALRRPPAASL